MFITPQEIKTKARRSWDRQQVLRAELRDESLFPLDIPFRKPDARMLLDDFSACRDSIQNLRSASKEQKGYGYQIQWKEIRHRRLGQQRLPQRIFFESSGDLLRYIGKEADFRNFKSLMETGEQPTTRGQARGTCTGETPAASRPR